MYDNQALTAAKLFRGPLRSYIVPKVGLPTMNALSPSGVKMALQRVEIPTGGDLFLDLKIQTGDPREVLEILEIWGSVFPNAYINVLPAAFYTLPNVLPQIPDSRRLRILSLFNMSFRGGSDHADSAVESSVEFSQRFGCDGIIMPGSGGEWGFEFARRHGLKIVVTGVRRPGDRNDDVHALPVEPGVVREINPFAFVLGNPVLNATDPEKALSVYLEEAGALQP